MWKSYIGLSDSILWRTIRSFCCRRLIRPPTTKNCVSKEKLFLKRLLHNNESIPNSKRPRRFPIEPRRNSQRRNFCSQAHMACRRRKYSTWTFYIFINQSKQKERVTFSLTENIRLLHFRMHHRVCLSQCSIIPVVARIADLLPIVTAPPTYSDSKLCHLHLRFFLSLTTKQTVPFARLSF